MYKTLDEAIVAFDLAMADVANDMGGEATDDNAYDLVVSITYVCEPEVARELCRTQLGFIPDSLHRGE
jgi:hypothetical protein